MSVCDVRVISGQFTTEGETYSVEPVDETLSGRHRVYRVSPTHAHSIYYFIFIWSYKPYNANGVNAFFCINSASF